MPSGLSSLDSPLADPLPGYAGLSGRYDECRAEDGSLRPHWAEFLQLLGTDLPGTLRAASDACHRAIIEQDVSMNVYAQQGSTALPWPLDAVPLLVSAGDWSVLSAGLRQRAHLYNHLLNDLYGPQALLRSGAIPPELIMANPHFLRPAVGLGRAHGVFLHHYAVDIARSPDGQWWVLQDRLDAPSGLGYALLNRIIAREALPQAFNRAPVEKLYTFFSGFRNSMRELVPGRAGEPRVVFLTPGAANETYFEHSYLARYLGYPLVEGADLTTRDRQVFLRTVGGLKRVDAVMRRVDSAFCDPLELHGHSLLGVPGLVHAAHGGKITLANQLGGGALENTGLLSYLAPLCRTVLGEDLRLPSVATWWCGQEKARDYVLRNLSSLVVKPTLRERGTSQTRYGPLMNETQRDALARSITERPWAHCGQERVLLGTTPAWREDALQPVPFVLRLFVSWQDGDYRVMPGGLTRFSPAGEDAIVSLQLGSVTKDTWIFQPHEQADNFVPPAVPLVDTVHRATDTPSRLADNLFWLGRYLERSTQLARLVRRVDPLLRDELAALDPAVAHATLRLLLAAQYVTTEADEDLETLTERLKETLDDPSLPGSLASNIDRLRRNLEQARTHLPPEAWPILRRLRTAHWNFETVGELAAQLSALEALLQDSLARDLGWRFLMLGRHIERGLQMVFITRELSLTARLDSPGGGLASEFLLQTLLHFADSLFTYRSTYHSVFHPAPVLSWLLGAAENPRSLRFQADCIGQHLAALPDEHAARAVAAVRASAARLASRAALLDAHAIAADDAQARAFLNEATATLADLSSQLTHIYFSHSETVAAIP